MATDWAVTTATERIELDSERKASTTFTVSNPGTVTDRVVFDVLPGDGTTEDWFHVDTPLRQVKAGDSVSYSVLTKVPVGVPDGTYSYQAMVYSADVPPEENSKLSGRITFDLVNPEPAKKPPWLLIGIIAAAVVALAITAWLVFSGGGTTTVPDLANKSEADAVQTLNDAGLGAGLRHRLDPAHQNLVVEQDPAAGTEIDDGGTVNFVVAINLTAPALAAPPADAAFTDVKWPELKWQAVPGAAHYQVTVGTTRCNGPNGLCTRLQASTFNADGTSFTPPLPLPTPGSETIVMWSVQPVDDFGTAGPASGEFRFRLGAIIIG